MTPPGRLLSLAHLTVLDTTPPELVSVAAAAGFPSVGIRLTATPSVGVPPYDMLERGAAPAGNAAAHGGHRRDGAGHGVPPLRARPAGGVPEGFLEVSARLGARHVLVMSAEPDEARTLERFCDLCDRAAPYGLTVGLEFAVYTGVRTLAHAAELVRRSGRANTSVLIDALHFSRSGGWPAHVARRRPVAVPLRAALRRGARHARPRDTPALIREARTGRLLPGQGALPLADLVAALPADLPLAVEAPCRATAELPAVERARRAHRALAALVAPRE